MDFVGDFFETLSQRVVRVVRVLSVEISLALYAAELIEQLESQSLECGQSLETCESEKASVRSELRGLEVAFICPIAHFFVYN